MKSYSEFLLEASSIIQGRRSSKKVSYRGPTGDHKRDKDGNIVASHYKKTRTILLDRPAKKKKKKKKNKNQPKIKQSKQPKQKLPWKPKTPEERKEILAKMVTAKRPSTKKQRGTSPRYKTTNYKNLRPASERMGKSKLKEDAPTMSSGNGGFGSNPENPANQGYDPLMKMMSRWKKAKTYPNKMADVVNAGKYGR